MNTKEGCLITKILCLMTLTVSIGSHVFAVPIIDGRFNPSEGYTNGFYVNFEVEGMKKGDPRIPVDESGELWLYQDPANNDLFFAFIQRLTLVDNSCGTNAIGWGASAPSGKNHKFQDLIGSDKAQFVFTDDDGNTVLDITVDYLHGFGYKPDGKPDKNLPPFRSGGVTDGDGKVNSGSKLDVLAAATSLQYNWNTFGDTYPELFGKDSYSPAADENYNVDDPSLSNWVFEVIYEVRVDGNLFDIIYVKIEEL